jgi:hypothetical protein
MLPAHFAVYCTFDRTLADIKIAKNEFAGDDAANRLCRMPGG